MKKDFEKKGIIWGATFIVSLCIFLHFRYQNRLERETQARFEEAIEFAKIDQKTKKFSKYEDKRLEVLANYYAQTSAGREAGLTLAENHLHHGQHRLAQHWSWHISFFIEKRNDRHRLGRVFEKLLQFAVTQIPTEQGRKWCDREWLEQVKFHGYHHSRAAMRVFEFCRPS